MQSPPEIQPSSRELHLTGDRLAMGCAANSGLRIAIASTGLGHVSRGIETWADDLARALARRGESVILCKGGGSCRAEYERVIPCLQRDAKWTARLLRWLPRRLVWRFGLGNAYNLEQTSFALGLIRHLRRERIDILHVQDPRLAKLVQLAGKFRLVRTRAILGHGTEESLDSIRKFDYLQHLAPWHLEEAKKSGVWKPTWTAIPNFIDIDRFHPTGPTLRDELGIPADAIVVLSVAAIKRTHKRIDYLIDEFDQLRRLRPDLPLWLVVAGGWEKGTDELVALGRQRLGDRARFLVRFPRERIPDLYRTADVFVLCSLMEMMPIALLEAMASGLPCVVNRHPVMEWMIGPGGHAIEMATPGALAQSLLDLSADRAARVDLGLCARDYCCSHFGQDRVVDQILAYYEFVLSQDRLNPTAKLAEMH